VSVCLCVCMQVCLCLSVCAASGGRLRVTSDPSQRDFDVRYFILYLDRVRKHLCVCLCVCVSVCVCVCVCVCLSVRRLVVGYASLATQVNGTLTFATSFSALTE